MSVRKGHGLEARLGKGMTPLSQLQAVKQKDVCVRQPSNNG